MHTKICDVMQADEREEGKADENLEFPRRTSKPTKKGTGTPLKNGIKSPWRESWRKAGKLIKSRETVEER